MSRRRALAVSLLAAAPALGGCDIRPPAFSSVARQAKAALAAAFRQLRATGEADAEAHPNPRPNVAPAHPEVPVGGAPESIDPSPRSDEPSPGKPDGPRVYAKTRFVWVRDQPSWSSPWLGYLFPGESVKVKSPRPVYAFGCEVWYEVEPRGYVCVDGKRATLDVDDRDYRAVAAYTPDFSEPVPHRYAKSLGAERYGALPTKAEQRAREPDLRNHLELVELARNGEPRNATLLGVDLAVAAEEATPFESLPIDIQIPRNTLKRNSAIAYTKEYRHEGRSFLLTPDFAWVPKDRVRPYVPSTFHGVKLGDDVKLPLAFFRERDQPQFTKVGKKFQPNGQSFARLSWVALTGRQEIEGWDIYRETSTGTWVRTADAVLPTPSERTPWGAPLGSTGADLARPAGRATWIEVSIYGGWLIAYEDTHPVYATLISPGRGGAPHGAQDPIVTASTPVGRFAVTGKFVTATMDAPDGATHTDVPWTQNFSGVYAVHAAYWHDAWGERVSGGCVNVSPVDGFWLFQFSEPSLPPGWHGVRSDPRFDPMTIVMVHR